MKKAFAFHEFNNKKKKLKSARNQNEIKSATIKLKNQVNTKSLFW